MNFSQVQSFIAVADTGRFTEAAAVLHLTQSAVSHALAALERELGVTLLERNRSGAVALTAAGHRIIPHARALLAQAEAISQEAKTLRGEAAGRLRLGSLLSIVSPRLLARLLTACRQQYPALEVVLFEGTLREVGEWIDTSVVDLGFVLFAAPGIETTPLLTDELCAIVPAQHRLRTQRAVTARDLDGEGWIIERNQCTVQLLEVVLGQRERRPQVRYQATDSATILAMVREGLGVSVMPRTVLPARLDGVRALPFDPPGHLQLGLAVKSQAVAAPGARLFIEMALNVLHEHAVHPALATESASVGQ